MWASDIIITEAAAGQRIVVLCTVDNGNNNSVVKFLNLMYQYPRVLVVGEIPFQRTLGNVNK